jgi:hypothetical protein
MRSIRHIRLLIVLSGKILEVVRVLRPGLVIVLGMVLGNALAQTDSINTEPKTRAERKALRREIRVWRKELKQVTPLDYKAMVREQESRQLDLTKYKTVLDKINQDLNLKLKEINALRAENARQKATLDSMRLASSNPVNYPKTKKGKAVNVATTENNQGSVAEVAAQIQNIKSNVVTGKNGINNQNFVSSTSNNRSQVPVNAPLKSAEVKTNLAAASARPENTGVKANNVADESITASNNSGSVAKNMSLAKSRRTANTVSAQASENLEANLNPVQANEVVFKVQIGAFRNRNLQKYLNNSRHFTGETDPDGLRKYTLGFFNDYWEANNFKRYMREMGVHDAWIVTYKDGKRVPIKDALENALSVNSEAPANMFACELL